MLGFFGICISNKFPGAAAGSRTPCIERPLTTVGVHGNWWWPGRTRGRGNNLEAVALLQMRKNGVRMKEKWVRQEILKGEGLVRYEKCRESKAQVPHMVTRGMVRPLDIV